MPQNLNPPNPPQDLTLIQMMETDVTQSPLGIVYPANRRGIEFKSSFLHQLSKFHGLDNEDPQRHLKSFHMLCVARCVEIGLPQLIFLIILSQYLSYLIHSGKNIFDRFDVLISVAIVWIYAHLLTVGGAYNHTAPKTQSNCRTDRSGLIDAAPWIRVPYPFQWGAPSFDAGEAFTIMMAAQI
ncbi:hypothetical protein LXL04_039359 [Taraxacum kok-saghyz]